MHGLENLKLIWKSRETYVATWWYLKGIFVYLEGYVFVYLEGYVFAYILSCIHCVTRETILWVQCDIQIYFKIRS